MQKYKTKRSEAKRSDLVALCTTSGEAEKLGSFSVFDYVDALHGHCSGASDPMSIESFEDCFKALKTRLDHWVDFKREYDFCVKHLVRVVLEEAVKDPFYNEIFTNENERLEK